MYPNVIFQSGKDWINNSYPIENGILILCLIVKFTRAFSFFTMSYPFLESLFHTYQSKIENKDDALIIFTHWCLISHGFQRLNGNQVCSFINTVKFYYFWIYRKRNYYQMIGHKDPIIPLQWNIRKMILVII